MKDLMQKRWFQTSALVVGTIAIMYGMIYRDVVSRAREAYQEGEKYWAWHHHPEQKSEALEIKLAEDLTKLEMKFNKGKLDKEQYDQDVKITRFDFQETMAESSIKYAYVWYQTAVELFSPPESKWVLLSRKKMPVAKEMWKEELRSKNIPFEDYMLE